MKSLAPMLSIIILISGILSTILPIRSVKAHPITVPDDYLTIQEAIDAADAGGIVFVRNGLYSETLVVNKALSLYGENRETTVIRGDGVANVVEITADDVLVTGFTIDGVEKGTTNDGIKLFEVEDCNLSENSIINNYFGVMLFSSLRTVIADSNFDGNTYGIGADACSNTLIKGNNVRNGFLGIGPDQCSNTTIAQNSITNNQFGIGIDFLLNNNTITGNIIENNGYGIWLNFLSDTNITGNRITNNDVLNNQNGIWLDSSPNSEIVGNNVAGNSYGIELYTYSVNNTIARNNVTGNSLCGIKLASSSHNRMEDNNVSGNPCGILLQGSSDNAITANDITANHRYGLRLVSTTNTGVSGNRFVNDGLFVFESYENTIEANLVNGKPLVYLEDESDCIVKDAGQVVLVNCNSIHVTDLDLSNTTVGVELWLTNHAAISRNKMSHDEYGIMLQSSCRNNINKNEITDNDYGVRLLSSTDNDLTENTLSGNGEGLFLDSANNRIYHNALIGNVREASVRDLPNAWDNGYPSGGNYWSNYVGADTFRGSQQDETGSDGIGDTSYMINENNMDKYPLMNRWLMETIKGDLNHDGTVSIFDIVAATSIYGCRNGDPNWNPEADLASPYGRIDIYDLLTCVGQYGKKHP